MYGKANGMFDWVEVWGVSLEISKCGKRGKGEHHILSQSHERQSTVNVIYITQLT